MKWCPPQYDEAGQPTHLGFLTRRWSKKGHFSDFDYNQSYFADDAALVFLSKHALVIGTQHVRDSSAKFSLKVHLGMRRGAPDGTDVASKTEVMYCPAKSNRNSIPDELLSGSYDLGDGSGQFVSFCEKLNYLGSMIAPLIFE